MATDHPFSFRCLALTTQRDPFPPVSIEVNCPENVIGVAVAHIYALHGLRVQCGATILPASAKL